MGSYGATFALFNHKYFGYISFVYLFSFSIPLYLIYKKPTFDFRNSELTVALFLLFFSSLLAQAILIENEYRGKLAGGFVDFLAPYIGVFGLWVFLFMITAIATIIVLDKSTQEVLHHIVSFLKKQILGKITSLKNSKEPKEEEMNDDFELEEVQ